MFFAYMYLHLVKSQFSYYILNQFTLRRQSKLVGPSINVGLDTIKANK